MYRDRSVWPWDQAYYGQVSLDLAYAFTQGPIHWLSSMVSAIGFKPPLLVWVAQAAVPLSETVGTVERALLLVNILISGGGLVILYRLGRRLGANTIQSLAGTLLCGGSSLFIGMTHQFFVEPLQVLVVLGLMQTSLKAETLSIPRLSGELLFWSSISFLVKSSSVGYVLPFIIYVAIVRLTLPSNTRRASSLTDWVFFALGALTLIVMAVWYFTNWSEVVRHAVLATVGPEASLWGEKRAFSQKLLYWIAALNNALFPWAAVGAIVSTLPVAAVLIASLKVVQYRSRHWLLVSIEIRLLYALTLLGTAAAGVAVYALQINEVTRFLMPMLPLLGLALTWSLRLLNRPIIDIVTALAVAVGACVSISGAHGVVWHGTKMSTWLKPYQADPSAAEKLMEAVKLTCTSEFANRYNIIGIDMPKLNATSAEFYSTKLRRDKRYKCFYASLGFAETDASRARSRIDAMNAPYVVTLSPSAFPPNANAFNRTSRYVSEQLSKDTNFTVSATLGDIVIFKRKGEP